MKRETMGWQWHQLDHMQIICTSLQTDDHASTTTLNFLHARKMLSWMQNQQYQSTENKIKALKEKLFYQETHN